MFVYKNIINKITNFFKNWRNIIIIFVRYTYIEMYNINQSILIPFDDKKNCSNIIHVFPSPLYTKHIYENWLYVKYSSKNTVIILEQIPDKNNNILVNMRINMLITGYGHSNVELS